eukprot:Phypoly_transcript_10437.p1 GENE.Phypoly_transcript_10437~~Phypoly_transcript_10437.p1  ORF type:complete len:218 (+),score=42.03 Phypoly_transcript_10437:618-1271(+)
MINDCYIDADCGEAPVANKRTPSVGVPAPAPKSLALIVLPGANVPYTPPASPKPAPAPKKKKYRAPVECWIEISDGEQAPKKKQRKAPLDNEKPRAATKKKQRNPPPECWIEISDHEQAPVRKKKTPAPVPQQAAKSKSHRVKVPRYPRPVEDIDGDKLEVEAGKVMCEIFKKDNMWRSKQVRDVAELMTFRNRNPHIFNPNDPRDVRRKARNERRW